LKIVITYFASSHGSPTTKDRQEKSLSGVLLLSFLQTVCFDKKCLFVVGGLDYIIKPRVEILVKRGRCRKKLPSFEALGFSDQWFVYGSNY
jgi:hypothetical protein